MRRLELGSGERPTPGYETSDINAFEGVDYVCSPENIGLPSSSLDEVLALGVMEHLTFAQFDLTLTNVYRLLKMGGEFVFDCPDLLAWCEYYSMLRRGEDVPFTEEHVLSTLYGWQRFGGDEHKCGWSPQRLESALKKTGFSDICISQTADKFIERGHDRRRFHRPEDAHLYIIATK